MPHAVFEPAPPLEEFWREFRPFKEVGEEGRVLEARSAFLRRDGGMLLIQSLVLESGPPLHFYVICEGRRGAVTIRCEQFHTIPRTDGVQALVSRVARQYRDLGGVVKKTNLDL